MATKLENTLKTLTANGASFSSAKTTLIGLGLANKDNVESILKNAGITKGEKGLRAGKGSNADIYRFITESPKTAKELETYIKANGSANKIRRLSNFEAIRVNVNSVFERFGEKPKTANG